MSEQETPDVDAQPLRRNRNFQLLWSGQMISSLGARASAVALPLLVLALTGSPALAGVVNFGLALPIAVLALPAGHYLDLLDRKRVMIACELARFVALGSVPVALLLGRLGVVQLVLVAAVEGAGFVLFDVAERVAVRQVVPPEQLSGAVVTNQARDYVSLLIGQPLGGVLFGIGQALPFLFDSVSYLISALTLSAIRVRFQDEAPRTHSARLLESIPDGFRWLLRDRFLRVAVFAVALSDLTLNTLFLVVVVAAREQHAPAAMVGLMFAFVGLGGIVGSLVAGKIAQRLPARVVVIGSILWVTALLPVLAVIQIPLLLGVVYAAMVVPFPAWNGVVGAYQLRTVPDHLQARVQSVKTLASLGTLPLGSLAVGASLQFFGPTTTILLLILVMLPACAAVVGSGAIRRAGRLT